MFNIMLVGLGGILGSYSRYYLGKYITNKTSGELPMATLVINITGAFILSFLAYYEPIQSLDNFFIIKYFVMTGFLGSYTTFSTFSFESLQMLLYKDYKNFSLYLVGTLTLGLGAAYSAMLLAGNL